MSDIGKFLALQRVKPFDRFSDFPTIGNDKSIYIDRGNSIQYIWNGNAYVQISSSGSQSLNFLGTYNALANTPNISSGSGTVGDFYVVSVANSNISPPIDGITNLQLDDQILAQPSGMDSIWVRVPALSTALPPVSINSSQVLSGINTIYLVDAQTDLTLTIPQATLDNQSRFVRIIKESGAGSITVVPDSGVSFIGESQSVLMRTVADVVTLFSTGTNVDGWGIIQRSLQDLLIEGVELLGDSKTMPLEDENWRVLITGNFLIFERREFGSWVERFRAGSSLTTDRYILDSTAGTIVFINSGGETRTLLKPSIDENGAVVGNPSGRVALVHSGEVLSVGFDDSITLQDELQLNIGESQSGNEFVYEFTTTRVQSFLSGIVNLANVPPNTIARVSLFSSTDAFLAESITKFEFEMGNGIPVSNGLNTLPLREPFPLSEGFAFKVKLELVNSMDTQTPISVAVQGSTENLNDGRGLRFVPYLVLNYYNGQQRGIQTQSEFVTFDSDLIIDNNNYFEYKGNLIFFTNSSTNATVTITDGLFGLNDEIIVSHYPVSSGSGTLNIKAGATGTINGSNTYVLLKNTSIKLKHLSGDDWFIVSESLGMGSGGGNHPVIMRRDTPTRNELRDIVNASIGGNSASWTITENQVSGNEAIVDSTITISALTNDLIDLNGNPISQTPVSKSGVLLSIGTIVRIFSETDLCVVDTPLKSSSNSFINLNSNSLVINSSNVDEYRNGVILFNHSSGLRTVTIEDNVFSVNDEINFKNYSDSAVPSARVRIIQNGIGANIDGNSNVTMRRGTSIKMKYIGNNEWRVLSELGNVSVEAFTDVHNFSINFPERVDVNPSKDPINVVAEVTFGVTNYQEIENIELHIGTFIFTLANSTTDGMQTQNVLISGVNLSSPTTYGIFIRINDDFEKDSDTQELKVLDLLPEQLLYLDLQLSNLASDFNFQSLTVQSQEILGSSISFTVPTFLDNRYLAIAQPSSEFDFISIEVNSIDQITAFTKNSNAILINSEFYDVWISNNALIGDVISDDSIILER